MNEYLKYEGRLAVKNQEANRLKLRLNGIVLSMRNLLDPFEDVGRLVGDQIADGALQFASLQAEYKSVLAEIEEINRVLGRG